MKGKVVLNEKGKIISQIGIEEGIKRTKKEIEGEDTEEHARRPKTPSVLDGFAEFSLPDSFILYVRKDLDAIEFFEKQVKDESVFASWIRFIKSKMAKGRD